MPTKKKIKTLTYKIGAKYVLTKTPKTLDILKNETFTVFKANSRDVHFEGRGMLVVSRDEIKRKLFNFKPAEDEVIKAATSTGFASINHADGTTSEYLESEVTEIDEAEFKLQKVKDSILDLKGGAVPSEIIKEMELQKVAHKVMKLFTYEQMKTLIPQMPQALVYLVRDHSAAVFNDEPFLEEAIRLFTISETRIELRNILIAKIRSVQEGRFKNKE